MIYAKSKEGNKIKATKGVTATCYHCGEKLIAKCGIVNAWHWSHSVKTECDDLKKEMTEWHINWQERFPENNREVKVLYENGYRIADVKLDDGMVIEFQHSPINTDVIWEREKAHKNMIWILDYTNTYFRIYRESKDKYFVSITGFKKNFSHANKDIYINFYENLIYCPKTFKIYKVIDGKTSMANEDDLPENNYSYAKCLSPNECVHNVVAFEKKLSKIKRAIRQDNEIIEILKDKDVLAWFTRQNKTDGFKSICNKKY